MVFYNCIPCNYSTKNKSDFKKHKNTKKHLRKSEAYIPKKSCKNTNTSESEESTTSIQRDSTRFNEIQEFNCKFCNMRFGSTTNYNRHLKTCVERKSIEKNKDLEMKLFEKEKLLKQKEKELRKSEKHVQKLEKDKDYYKGLITNLSTLGPKNFNSVTFILSNYAKAPHIRAIEPKKLEQFKDLDDTKVENVISYYRNNLLVDHIIEAIVYIHKKDDPSKQSVWVTDCSRHNYIIKELLEDKESYWTIDKKGTKSEKYLIDPILKFLRERIMEYMNKADEILNEKDLSLHRRSMFMDNQRDASRLVKDIDDGVLNKEVIKRLAPHIHHNTKPLIEEVE